MTAAPLVTVIMPAYNTGRYVSAAVESVAAQTYADWELLIVDDGSTDETGAIADAWARRDPARIRVVHQENGGIARARNRALQEMNPRAKFVAFLDSDDMWYRDTLARLVRAAPAGECSAGVHGYRTYIDGAGRQIQVNGAWHAPVRRRAVDRGRLRIVAPSAPTTFEVLAYGCCVFTGGLLVRAEAMKNAGSFDPDAVPAEDWDMWLRLSLAGPFGFLPEPLYGYRLHGANSTANTIRKNQSLYYVRRKFVLDGSMSASARATMMAGFRWYEIYRAAMCFREATRRLGAGALRNVAPAGIEGLQHLWTSVRPGQDHLGVLGAAPRRAAGV